MTNKFLHRVLWLLIPLLTLFNLSVWGDSKTTTFANYSSGTWATNKNPLPCASGGWSWASSATPNSFESSGSARGLQWSGATSTYLTTTQTGTITQVSIVASTNGTVSLSVTVGGTAFKNGDNTSLSVSSTANQTYTFSGSASGEISVYVNNTYKSAYVKSISVTYSTAPASKYTVTFNPQGGYFADESVFDNTDPYQIDEASAGAGVTLPEASTDCSGDGWAFYGWATSACSPSQGTAPTIVGKAGDTYNPTSDITLHAVFAKGEYTKETSSITSGSKYLIVATYGGHNYIMKSTDDAEDYTLYLSSGGYNYMQMAGALVDETSSNKYHASVVDPQWCYTIEGTTNNYLIRDVVNTSSENYADIAYDGWWGTDDNTDHYAIIVSAGVWTIQNDYNDKYLYFDATNLTFRSNASYTNLLLYKQTTTPAYFSSPTCCDKPTGLTKGSIS